MARWTAIVPLKGGVQAKSRLAQHLAPEARVRLAQCMARHVLDVLAASAAVEKVIALSPEAVEGVAHARDEGRGLNVELAALRARLAGGPLLVVHGDLPLLGVEDVAALTAAGARQGIALAPDRLDVGTNAVALATDKPFPFAFGDDSFARHCAAAGQGAAIVRRPGLACDVDRGDDLDDAAVQDWLAAHGISEFE